MKKKINMLSSLLLALFVLGISINAWATFISPKRLTIEDKQRTAAMIIVNQTDKHIVYSFEWEHRAQSPEGESLLLKEGETTPGYKPADQMLQFSPRKFILKPGENQKIRILVKRPPDLAEGEYHSHILIKADPLEEQQPPEGGATGVLAGIINLRTYSSIPVFLRQGKTTVNINLKSAKLIKKDGRDHISITLDNNSTRSVYAESRLDCTTSSGVVSHQMTTVRIYAEAKTKKQEIPVPAGISLAGCTALTYKLVGTDDFEYMKKTIQSIPVQR